MLRYAEPGEEPAGGIGVPDTVVVSAVREVGAHGMGDAQQQARPAGSRPTGDDGGGYGVRSGRAGRGEQRHELPGFRIVGRKVVHRGRQLRQQRHLRVPLLGRAAPSNVNTVRLTLKRLADRGILIDLLPSQAPGFPCSLSGSIHPALVARCLNNVSAAGADPSADPVGRGLIPVPAVIAGHAGTLMSGCVSDARPGWSVRSRRLLMGEKTRMSAAAMTATTEVSKATSLP